MGSAAAVGELVEVTKGVWHCPASPVRKPYFAEYTGYRGTATAQALNRLRCELVERCGAWRVLDVGIGSGEFLDSWRNLGRVGRGYDTDPDGRSWLHRRGLWSDPYAAHLLPGWVDCLSLWDVLEHLPNPLALVNRCRPGQSVCLSLPIFADLESVYASRHYKPGEHLWYFSREGLIRYLQPSFKLVEFNELENNAGRSGIGSFAFERV